METGDSDNTARRRAATLPRRELLTAEWLAGVPVLDAQGVVLGALAHVVLDVPRGTIAFAALTCPSLLASADRLVAVPWNLLAFDAEHRRFVLKLDPAQLRDAPQWDRAEWPLLADPQLATELRAYFGLLAEPPA